MQFSTKLISSALLALGACMSLAQTNPAVVPEPNTPNIWSDRWKEKLSAVQHHQYDLIWIGDSITHGWDWDGGRPVWDAFYKSRNAISLGYSGARTENLIWMLQNGAIDGQKPKVAVILIGTNNADQVHFSHADTPEHILEGISKITQLVREKTPDTKIILLKIFPRNNIPLAGAVADKAGELSKKLADNKSIFYLDINKVFLKSDGSIDPYVMPDLLHPNSQGYYAWAKAIEPLLVKLMGKQVNSATQPVSKLEQDSYDWFVRHNQILEANKKGPVDIAFIGDSITHFWSGEPKDERVTGPVSWKELVGTHRAVNLGFGWDRIQNVLWRLDNGEMDLLKPKAVVMLIGTNNLSFGHARINTDDEIVDGIKEIVKRVRRKSQAKIVLLGLLPRDSDPNSLNRYRIKNINTQLAKLKGVQFMDVGPQLVKADGTFIDGVTSDSLHPTEEGYKIIAAALKPVLDKILK